MSDRPRIDDNVHYAAFDGSVRQVRVTVVHEDIKNGRSGFEGLAPDGDLVWGYDDQIISITRREDIR